MEFTEIKPRIFSAKFDNQYQMCMTILRIVEQETPGFNNLTFTHDQIMDWYSKQSESGKFTYFEDYGGFCVVGSLIRKFKKNFTPGMRTEREIELLQAIETTVDKDLLSSNKRFTIICTYTGKDSIYYKHELAHALFYIDQEYKAAVVDKMRSIRSDVKKKMEQYLNELEYASDPEGMCPEDVIEEINCRLVSENSVRIAFSGQVRMQKKHMEDLKLLFKEHLNK